jgi:hypothetical protein
MICLSSATEAEQQSAALPLDSASAYAFCECAQRLHPDTTDAMNPSARLEDIEADIAEAERLMTALRLKIAVKTSVGEETTTDDRRLLKMMQGWMLLQGQRQRAFEADLAKAPAPTDASRPRPARLNRGPRAGPILLSACSSPAGPRAGGGFLVTWFGTN